ALDRLRPELAHVAGPVVVPGVDGLGVGAVREAVGVNVLAEEGLGVLGHARDADRDADADVATGEAGRDENHLRLVARADLDAVAGDEGRAGAAVVAAGAVALPRAYAREGVDVEDRDADRAGDSDRAAARAGDDRDDRLLAVRGDLDVVVRVHLCRVVDVRVGVERDEVDADADTDAGSP